jgi:uncharacterized HAD superfamily protein
MHVRVKEGCSVGIDGVFCPSRTELDLPAPLVMKHLGNLDPMDATAEGFFTAAGWTPDPAKGEGA